MDKKLNLTCSLKSSLKLKELKFPSVSYFVWWKNDCEPYVADYGVIYECPWLIEVANAYTAGELAEFLPEFINTQEGKKAFLLITKKNGDYVCKYQVNYKYTFIEFSHKNLSESMAITLLFLWENQFLK